jgi:hypothetical protein
LIDLLAAAHRKAVDSVAFVVYRTWMALRDERAHMSRPQDPFEIATWQFAQAGPAHGNPNDSRLARFICAATGLAIFRPHHSGRVAGFLTGYFDFRQWPRLPTSM